VLNPCHYIIRLFQVPLALSLNTLLLQHAFEIRTHFVNFGKWCRIFGPVFILGTINKDRFYRPACGKFDVSKSVRYYTIQIH
jgi:hypothetical protein